MLALHLFSTDLDWTALGALEALLDPEERNRAGRLRLPSDRDRFIARRGRLRLLLAEAVGCVPSKISYAHGEFGKPRLEGGGDLRFNLSHSDGLALCVIGRGVELGCDIERRREEFADEATAERFFALGERRSLRSLPHDRRVHGFFDCWTRKEAYVKALGTGLSCPLDSFEVSLAPRGTSRVANGDSIWLVRGFEPAPLYHAAVAVELPHRSAH